ncbi:hypothetical protein [Nocardia wallacei]|uniref:hypothetical protein n=1 Tax=Nocardia wallacei TaxID=480035 RepID=UPI002458D5DA|nr:hypothetical protein [Nocardia wallacei]
MLLGSDLLARCVDTARALATAVDFAAATALVTGELPLPPYSRSGPANVPLTSPGIAAAE